MLWACDFSNCVLFRRLHHTNSFPIFWLLKSFCSIICKILWATAEMFLFRTEEAIVTYSPYLGQPCVWIHLCPMETWKERLLWLGFRVCFFYLSHSTHEVALTIIPMQGMVVPSHCHCPDGLKYDHVPFKSLPDPAFPYYLSFTTISLLKDGHLKLMIILISTC